MIEALLPSTEGHRISLVMCVCVWLHVRGVLKESAEDEMELVLFEQRSLD